MRCMKCGSKDVVFKRRYSSQRLCKDCFIEFIQKKVLRNIRLNKLIEKGDRVLAGVSGGKDSVAMLDILNILHERGIIELEVLTVDEGIKNYREKTLEIAKYHTKRLGIPHHIVKFKDCFGITLDEIVSSNVERGPCTYCGVFRRWIFNKIGKKLEADKIAIAHNLDDETEAILMNYLEGNIKNLIRLGPISESKDFLTKIKPLREIPENEIILYTKFKGLKTYLKPCPYVRYAFRREIYRFIKRISAKHPTIRYSILRGFEKIKPILKEKFQEKYTFDTCKICGEPASGKICQACKLCKELGISMS
ncbi:PP-loop domain protein [Methanothermus fervidus DSM 2088]|uniref:PP-loop domain protein n=1 Tax=Methanothermus fervidus (strain ATCC 43054 / DSM 2088 / JCM 10308 / V24 S) TaxID=523846 RepID=E3GXY8_METFV|nr:TIGR00269 family protein [Methanothermus fervidus]ADP77170.1 PP-loop domain protein [Methanothermus fervidus DSM 2088]